jgi:hypothetical protein
MVFRSSVFFLRCLVFCPEAFSRQPKTSGAETEGGRRSNPQASRDNIPLNLGRSRVEGASY